MIRTKRVSSYTAVIQKLTEKYADLADEEVDKVKAKLSKAKEIINEFVELKNKPCAAEHSVNMLLYDNICAEAEHFLKEVSE